MLKVHCDNKGCNKTKDFKPGFPCPDGWWFRMKPIPVQTGQKSFALHHQGFDTDVCCSAECAGQMCELPKGTEFRPRQYNWEMHTPALASRLAGSGDL